MQRPPEHLLARAQAEARAAGHAIYLFREPEGWKVTRRLSEVPGGALSLEVPPTPEDPEKGNTGGC